MRGGRGLAAAGIAVVMATLSACTSSGPTGSAGSDPAQGRSSSVTRSSSAPGAYRDLLLSTADIPIPGLTLKAITTGGATAQGAAAEFAEKAGDVVVADVISVFSSADDAGIALQAAVGVAPEQLDNPQSRDLDSGGKAYSGTESGAAVTLVVFTVDRAFVTLRFQSDPGSPISSDVVDRVIATQTAKIRNGLH